MVSSIKIHGLARACGQHYYSLTGFLKAGIQRYGFCVWGCGCVLRWLRLVALAASSAVDRAHNQNRYHTTDHRCGYSGEPFLHSMPSQSIKTAAFVRSATPPLLAYLLIDRLGHKPLVLIYIAELAVLGVIAQWGVLDVLLAMRYFSWEPRRPAKIVTLI